MKRTGLFLFVFSLVIFSGLPGFSASWKVCDGVPVRPKYQPMGIFWDQCSMPSGSAQERAFFSALYETRNYVHALGFGAGFTRIHNGRCIIEHDNGRSDVALVSRADIDGALGLTRKERDCEDIITADIMIAADLSFERADESAVITNPSAGSKTGAIAMLHEVGHALGLEHSTGFSVMRFSTAVGLPFAGMTPSSGGLGSELTGDDVFGISHIYGFDPSYRNIFVSSQLLRSGMVVDNNIDPTKGDAPHPDPLLVCPGDVVNFYATVVNNSSVREQFQVAVYADSDPNAYYFPTSGALALFDVSLGRGEGSFPVQFTVPASLPSNVTQNVFVSIPTTLLWERKGYDNAARSRLRIRRKPGC